MKLSHLTLTIAAILPLLTAPVAAGTFSQPGGLAVDPNGNLYVANQTSNKVLVFDKNFAPQPQLTITAGLDQPISLALDTPGIFGGPGILYVGNIGNTARITSYALGGAAISNISFYAFRPYALAMGADHVLYEFDNATTLNIYNTAIDNYKILSVTLNANPGIGAIGSDNGIFFFGNGQTLKARPEIELLSNIVRGNFGDTGPIAGSTFAMAFDNFHNGFITDPTNNAVVVRLQLGRGALTLISKLTSFPSGIAVDKARNRLFVSFPNTNTVNVYKITYDTLNQPMTATLLTTLK
jgi:DNA-binding beta-propeller fold protein YncE